MNRMPSGACKTSRPNGRLFAFQGLTDTRASHTGAPFGHVPIEAYSVDSFTRMHPQQQARTRQTLRIIAGSPTRTVISSALAVSVAPSLRLAATSKTARKLLIQKETQASSFRIQALSWVLTVLTQLNRTLRSRTVQTLIALSTVLGLPACAAPKAPSDPVVRFLRDRGLIETPAGGGTSTGNGLFGSVRDHASDLVMTAMNFLGVPYRYGGTSEESGFDCSGFTRHVFESSLGLILPRKAEDQAQASGMLNIQTDELKPGDLVFFNTMRRAFSHVGIYVGDGKFIHAPRTGSTIRVEDMRQAYWTARFNGARRVPEVSSGSTQGPFSVPSATVSSSQTP